MPALFEYLLKANISLLLFCAGYYAVLRRLTFYSLNRIYLICALLFSAIYPLVDLSAFVQQHQQLAQPVQAVQIIMVNWQAPVKAAAPKLIQTDWWMLGRTVFFAGIMCMMIRFGLQLVVLYRLIRKAKHQTLYNYRVKAIDQQINPFSFWQSIYINPHHHEPEQLKAILAHEQVHVTGWHTLDILLAELSLIAYWFNPGVWLIKKAIAENIEFITDRTILQQGADSKQYQYSLLHVALTAGTPAMVNHFNFSKLKKRIMMMNSEASSKSKLMRYLFILPLVCILLLCFTFSKANVAVKAKKAIQQITHLINKTTVVASSNSDVNYRRLTIRKQSISRLTEADTVPVSAKKVNSHDIPEGNSEPYPIITGNSKKVTSLNLRSIRDTPSIEFIKGKSTKTLPAGDSSKKPVIYITTNSFITGQNLKYNAEHTGKNIIPSVNGYKGVTLKPLTITGFSGNALTWRSGYKTPDTIFVGKSGTTVKMSNGNGAGKNFVVVDNGPRNAKSKSIINGTDFSTFDNNQHLLLIADNHEVSISILQSLSPNRIGSIAVLNSTQATNRYGKKGKNGALLITTKVPSYAYINDRQENQVTKLNITRPSPPEITEMFKGTGSNTFTYQFNVKGTSKKGNVFSTEVKPDSIVNKTFPGRVIIQGNGVEPEKARIIINGKAATYPEYTKIPPDSVKSVSILKNPGATILYGDKAKNGVIIITTKKP